MAAYRQRLRNTFGIVRPLYPDGVHPNGWAQYPIAKVLWDRLNFAGALLEKGQPRRLSTPVKPVAVDVSVDARFLEPGDPLTVRLRSAKPTDVVLTWSYGNRRGQTPLRIPSAGMQWTVPLKPGELGVAPGQNRTFVFDLASGANRSLYILDLTGTRVWDLDEAGGVGGDLPHDGSPKHGTWRIAKHARGLLLSGTVIDDDIQDAGRTPGGRDGVQVMLDLRQDARFADLSFDEDVHLFCLNVQEKPRLGLGILPLWGRGLSCAGHGGVQRTAKGYAWHFFISQGFKDGDKPFDVEQSEFVGFNIDIVDRDRGKDGKVTGRWIQFTKTDYLVQAFPTFLHIIDMKNQLKASEVRVLSLWGG